MASGHAAEQALRVQGHAPFGQSQPAAHRRIAGPSMREGADLAIQSRSLNPSFLRPIVASLSARAVGPKAADTLSPLLDRLLVNWLTVRMRTCVPSYVQMTGDSASGLR